MQVLRYVADLVAVDDHQHDLHFTPGQAIEGCALAGVKGLYGQLLGDFPTDVAPPGIDLADGEVQFILMNALGEVARGPGAQHLQGKRVHPTGRERHHLDVEAQTSNAHGGFQPADAGHENVHQDDMGHELPRQIHGLLPVFSLRDNAEAVAFRKHLPQAHPKQPVAVHY